jgi:hypothetical protein
MKKDIVKIKIKKTAIKNGGIIGCLAVIFAGAFFYNSSKNDEIEKLNRDYNSMNSDIENTKRDFEQTEKSFQIYKNIPKDKLVNDIGFDLNRDRLRVLYPEVQRLKDVYSFKKLNATISETNEYKEVSSSVFTVFDGDIIIEIAGISDEFIFSFIEELKNNLPGFVYIKNLNINKEQDITDEAIKSYLNEASGNGFVSGKITLGWITFKDKKANEAGNKNNLNNN